MKYCPKCQKEYASDVAQFCNICGSALIDKDINEKEMEVFCPSCGKQVPYDQQYCFHCGANLRSDNKINGSTKDEGDNNRTALIVVIVVAVVAVIGAIGIRLFNTYFGKKPDPSRSVTVSQTSDPDSFQIDTTEANNQSDSTNTDNNSTTKAITTTAPSTTTVSETQVIEVPFELQKYADDLVYEGCAYRITLQEDDWYINYRSEPVYIDINTSNNNVVGKLKSGTEIYVEYIYNETWAVFKKDGRYVFSSLYGSNDPTHNKLMAPIY